MNDTPVTYVGLGDGQLSMDDGFASQVGVIEGTRMRPLPLDNPAGRPLGWGHWGPGPLHLAESILLHRLGFSPPGVVALTFSEDVVSELPDQFELDAEEVDRWISEYLLTGCLTHNLPAPVAV